MEQFDQTSMLNFEVECYLKELNSRYFHLNCKQNLLLISERAMCAAMPENFERRRVPICVDQMREK